VDVDAVFRITAVSSPMVKAVRRREQGDNQEQDASHESSRVSEFCAALDLTCQHAALFRCSAPCVCWLW
jgi:hypothetical protein